MRIRIYSVGVWNNSLSISIGNIFLLEFTPLEFETAGVIALLSPLGRLEFTPLEFETKQVDEPYNEVVDIRIYSVGVWNFLLFRLLEPIIWLEFTPLEFETREL